MREKQKPPATTPTPGSDAARGRGCRCPQFDNGHGRGFLMHGERVYWIAEGCPLHGMEPGHSAKEKPE